MRLNKFIAHHTPHSRREADQLIAGGKVTVNGEVAKLGQRVEPTDAIAINGHQITQQQYTFLALNKPVGYLSSRRAQAAPTLFELLPSKYHHLNTVGRLDKNSSGLILLTNDGTFAHEMTHPSFGKQKVYEVRLDRDLNEADKQAITAGLPLEDGVSALALEVLDARTHWRVTMQEGRNRQIRRTFAALDYNVLDLHRIQFGPYQLNGLKSGKYKEVDRV